MNYKNKDKDIELYIDDNEKKSFLNNKNIYNLYNRKEEQDDNNDDYDYYIELKNKEENEYKKLDNIVKMHNKLLNYCKLNNLDMCELITIDVLIDYINHLEKS